MIDTEIYEALNAASDKLDAFLEKNKWTVEAQKDHYPMTFRFREDSYDGEGVPEIELTFRNTIRVSILPKGYKVDEKFLNRLKNLSKEVYRTYMLVWFSRKKEE